MHEEIANAQNYGESCNTAKTANKDWERANRWQTRNAEKEIICCWGNLENAAEDIQKEAGSVIGILTASKKTLLAVSDGEHRNCHPLSPSVRKYFELVPYDVKGGKQE